MAQVKAAHELEPGEYIKRPVDVDGVVCDVWWVCTPNGLLGRLLMPEDNMPGGHHRVIEHDDGTISVPRPGPGEPANSIRITGWPLNEHRRREPGEGLMSWHGYIDHGVWEPC